MYLFEHETNYQTIHYYFLGLNTEMIFDRLYTVTISQMQMRDFNFTGYSNSIIAFHKNAANWKLEMPADKNKYTITNGTLPPFGTKEYLLSNSLGGGIIALNINACDDKDEYNCEDGSCIPIEERCNSKFDCADGSDESKCHMIDVPNCYLRHVSDQDGASVTLNVDIAELLAISEVSEIFTVKYQLTMEWQDKRLTYLNLKEDSYLNVVSQKEATNIWLPVIIFENTHDREHSKVRK